MNHVSAQRSFISLKPQTRGAALLEYVSPSFHFFFVYFSCREPLPLPALSAECASPASDASSFLSLSAPHFRPYNFPAACVLGTFCGEFQIISGCPAVATSVCVSVASYPLWPCVQVHSSHSGWAQTDRVYGVRQHATTIWRQNSCLAVPVLYVPLNTCCQHQSVSPIASSLLSE